MVDGASTDIWGHIVALRTELIDQLSGLPAERWDAPSLCTEWRVRDVAAHLILPERMSIIGTVVGLARAGFNLGRYLSADAVKRGSVPLDTLISQYREGIQRRTLPPGRRPEHLLADIFAHVQDIRRPLELPWSCDPELVTLVISTVAADRRLGVPRRIAGLRFRTTDLDWSYGEGEEVTGTGEALVLAMTGRSVVLPELAGSGTETLRSRLA